MRIKFSTSRLESIYLGSEKEVVRVGLQPNVLKAYRKTIDYLFSVDSILDIKKIRGYNLEKYEDHRSLRLNDKRRLEVAFINGEIRVIDVLWISNHYGIKIR